MVVPKGLESTEGSASGDPNFSGQGFRAQVAYSSDEFGDLPDTHKVIIAIALRPDASITEPRTVDWGITQWIFSTTDRSVDDMSDVFSENHGADRKTVYDGPLTFHTEASGPIEGPRGFDYRLELDEPFMYDPALGTNLVIDFIAPSGYTPASREDSHDIGGRQLFAAIPENGTSANFVFSEELVLQISFVPEPSTLTLGAIGVAALVHYGGRIRSRPPIGRNN